MDSFQAKIGWKRMRNSENKNYRSVPFCSYPTRNRNFQKSSKKIQKIKKIPLWLHFSPKQVGRGREKQKIKINVPFRSYPALNNKLKKNSKKIPKTKKHRYGFISSQNRLENDEMERK